MAITLTTHRPAHTFSAQVLVCYIFSNSRPPKGIAGYVDWIMDGQISDLILKSKVKGKFCESLLLVTGTKIKSYFLLIIGVGNPKKLNTKMVKEIGHYTIKALDGLKVSRFGLYPHDLFLPHLNIFETMDKLFEGLKDSANEDTKISILSNDQAQEDIITRWIKEKIYMQKPQPYGI